MNIIQRFICRYIVKNMHHDAGEFRSGVFKAIYAGMAEAFPEDNIYNRMDFIGLQLGLNSPSLMWNSNADSLAQCLSTAFVEGITNKQDYPNYVN